MTWDGSAYDPNKYGEQIITGELHVEKSSYTDNLEPTSTVRATARITLIDDRVFTPTLEPPTYSKQLYGGDLCFIVFSDKYLSGGKATANGETVFGKFTLDEDQEIYGHSLTASTLLQAGSAAAEGHLHARQPEAVHQGGMYRRRERHPPQIHAVPVSGTFSIKRSERPLKS